MRKKFKKNLQIMFSASQFKKKEILPETFLKAHGVTNRKRRERGGRRVSKNVNSLRNWKKKEGGVGAPHATWTWGKRKDEERGKRVEKGGSLQCGDVKKR